MWQKVASWDFPNMQWALEELWRMVNEATAAGVLVSKYKAMGGEEGT